MGKKIYNKIKTNLMLTNVQFESSAGNGYPNVK